MQGFHWKSAAIAALTCSVQLCACSSKVEPADATEGFTEAKVDAQKTKVEPEKAKTKGRLRLNAPGNSYDHKVVITDAAGKTVASGHTGDYLDVPAGQYKASVMGHTLDITVTADKPQVIEVAEALGLGQVRVYAPGGSYDHGVEIKDAEGKTVASGKTGNSIDVPAGKYTVTAMGKTFDAEVTTGKQTTLEVKN